MRRPWPPAALAFTVLALTTTGYAQTSGEREAARKLGAEGIEAYRAENYEHALDRLTRAHNLVGLSTTGLWRARTLRRLGRWVEASDQYLEVARMRPDPDANRLHREAIEEAKSEREELLPSIPEATLLGPVPADAEVKLDGVKVPRALIGVARPLDPGAHRAVVMRGERQVATDFVLGEGTNKEIVLGLPERPPPRGAQTALPVPVEGSAADDLGHDESSEVQVALGWVALGLGGGALVAGAVTGGLGLDKQSQLSGNCPDEACEEPFHADVDEYETLRAVSIGSLVAGGLLAVTGVTLLLTAPIDDHPSAGVALDLLPVGARLRLSF